jgi:hypothetical protein
MSEQLSPERAVRLLRAKAAELESAGLELTEDRPMSATVKLSLDIALIAGLLAGPHRAGQRRGDQDGRAGMSEQESGNAFLWIIAVIVGMFIVFRPGRSANRFGPAEQRALYRCLSGAHPTAGL